MAITWRSVQAPEQGSANALFSNGAQTLLGGFDKITNTAKGVEDARKLLEQKANEDVLGQLQAASVANSVDPALRNVLVGGQMSGLDGKGLSALAASISGQQTTNANTKIAEANAALNVDKFGEANRQFGIQAGQKDRELAQKDSQFQAELGFQRDQSAQNQGQFDAKMLFEEGKFNYEKADTAMKNNIAMRKANNEDTSGMDEAFRQVVTSDKFKTATQNEQFLMIAPFVKPEKLIPGINDTRPDVAKGTGSGNAKGVDAALKPYISDPRYNQAEDQNALQAVGNQAVADNIKPEVAMAAIAARSDSAYFGNWAAGQDLPAYSASEIIDYARKKGVDPYISSGKTGNQGTAKEVSPEGQAQRERLRPTK